MNTRDARTAVLAALIAVALAACDDDDAEALRCGEHACERSCAELAGPACNVLEGWCRQRIARALGCVRGTAVLLPEIRTLTEQEYRGELLDAGPRDGSMPVRDAGDVDEDAGGGDPGADASVGTNDEPKADPWSVALALIGLLPAGGDVLGASVEDSVENVAGYYDGRRRRITLIDRDDDEISWGAIRLFAHEVEHAVQDQTLGLRELDRRSPGSFDGQLAFGCLIEGEADLYSELALSLLQGLPFDHAYFEQRLASALKYSRRSLLQSSAPYAALWQMRYPLGTRYLYDAYRAGGSWEVQALFEAPPTSTVQWMVGYDRNTARREPLLSPLACPAAAVPDGYHVYFEQTFGALALVPFLARALRSEEGLLASEEHWQNALHWRQDSFTVFENDAGKVAISYRVRFDGTEIAHEIAARLSERGRFRVVEHGPELEILAAEDGQELPGWQTDPASCPEPP